MYFYLEKGKQVLDLKGDLILSFNDKLAKARVKSAGPVKIKSPDGYVLNIGKFTFFKRLRLTFNVIGFIWGKDQELRRVVTNYRESHRANVANNHPNKCQCEGDNDSRS